MPQPVVEYLHVLFGFTYVSAIMSCHWNTLAARRNPSWAERALLFEQNRKISLFFGLGALLATGILGQWLAMQMGYRMSTTRPFQIANALWLINVLVLLVFDLPLSSRLAAQARSAANSTTNGEPVGWTGAVDRWRIGNAVQLLVFLVLLWFMLTSWK